MTFLQWVKIYKGTSTHFVSHVYLDALLFDGEKIRSCNLHDVSRLATQLKIGTNVRTWTRGKRKGKKRRISRFGKINAIYVELGPPVPALERPLDILRLAFYRRWGKKPKLWAAWTSTSAQSNLKTPPRPEDKKTLAAEKWQTHASAIGGGGGGGGVRPGSDGWYGKKNQAPLSPLPIRRFVSHSVAVCEKRGKNYHIFIF